MGIVSSASCTLITLPFPEVDWIPEPGSYGYVPMLNAITDVDPTDETHYYAASSNQALSIAWCGACFAADYSPYGALVIHNGGDDDWNGNDVYVADLTSLLWSRILGPSPYTANTNAYTNISDALWSEYPDGSWLIPHTYDGIQAIPASWGQTGSKGGLLLFKLPGHLGTTVGLGTNIVPHFVDLENPSYERWKPDPEYYSFGLTPYSATARDDARECIWVIPGISAGVLHRFNKDKSIQTYSGYNLGAGPGAMGYAPPPYDLLLALVGNASTSSGFAVKVNPALSGSWGTTPTVGTGPTWYFNNTCNPIWDAAKAAFCFWEPDTEKIFLLSPPSDGQYQTSPWVWSSEVLLKSPTYTPTPYSYAAANPPNPRATGGQWSKWQYVPALAAYIYWHGGQIHIMKMSP